MLGNQPEWGHMLWGQDSDVCCPAYMQRHPSIPD